MIEVALLLFAWRKGCGGRAAKVVALANVVPFLIGFVAGMIAGAVGAPTETLEVMTLVGSLLIHLAAIVVLIRMIWYSPAPVAVA